MIAIDWSHTKGLVVYNGRKLEILDRRVIAKRLAGGESKQRVKSISALNPPAPTIIKEGKDGI